MTIRGSNGGTFFWAVSFSPLLLLLDEGTN